jgi:hypothetical protein
LSNVIPENGGEALGNVVGVKLVFFWVHIIFNNEIVLGQPTHHLHLSEYRMDKPVAMLHHLSKGILLDPE